MKKAVLMLMKATPVVAALCTALNSLLSYFDIDLVFLGYVAISFFLITWYLLSLYFRFCTFYRLLILYTLTAEVVNTVDYVYLLPISNWAYFVLHCGIIGLFIIIFTYIHVRDTRKLKKHLGVID